MTGHAPEACWDMSKHPSRGESSGKKKKRRFLEVHGTTLGHTLGSESTIKKYATVKIY